MWLLSFGLAKRWTQLTPFLLLPIVSAINPQAIPEDPRHLASLHISVVWVKSHNYSVTNVCDPEISCDQELWHSLVGDCEGRMRLFRATLPSAWSHLSSMIETHLRVEIVGGYFLLNSCPCQLTSTMINDSKLLGRAARDTTLTNLYFID